MNLFPDNAESAARVEYVQARSIWRDLPEAHPQYRCQALVDPYQGCAYACRYCFGITEESLGAADPSQVRTGVKTNGPYLLAQELKRRSAPVSVLIGAMTEPYQPVEAQFRVTRQCLELLFGAGYPVHLLTKSRGVLEDVELLAPQSEKGLAAVTVSISTLKPGLVDWLEPLAPEPVERLAVVRSLADRGIIAGVALAPVMPRLTDSPALLKDVLRAAADAGAAYVLPSAFAGEVATDEAIRRSPWGTFNAALFLQALGARHPELLPFYTALTEGGSAEYEAWRAETWGTICELCEELRLPLRVPVDGAPALNSLPAGLWTATNGDPEAN